MCTSPIKLLNPKYKALLSDFDRDADGLYIKVACGKCPTCQFIHNTEWLTRMAYEYEYTLEQKGWVYWDTLTLRPQDVPNLHGLMCFKKEHHTSFCKKLRVNMERWFKKQLQEGKIPANLIDDFDPTGKIKILWVSEYGGEYGRPHYHILIFVTFPIDWLTMTQLVKKSWIHGFTDGELHPIETKRVIQSWRGIAYAAKYLQKDIEFERVLKEQKNSTFYSWLREVWPSLYGEAFNNQAWQANTCERFKKLLHELDMDEAIPYFRVSHHFGEYGMAKLSDRDFEKGTTLLKDTQKGYQIVKIPTYLMRKRLYAYDKIAKTWNLNDFGRKCKAMRVEERFKQETINLDMYMEYIIHGVESSTLDKLKINQKYVENLWDKIKKDNITHQKIIYTLTFRGYASDYLYEKINKNPEEVKEIYQDIISVHNYDKLRRRNNTTREKLFANKTTEMIIGHKMQVSNEVIRYVLSIYDTAERLFLKERAHHLEHRQKQQFNSQLIKSQST